MKKITLSLIIYLATISSLSATVYTSISNGDWTSSSSWSPSGVPDLSNWPGDEVIIAHDIIINQNLTLNHQSKLTVQNGASLISTKNITLSTSFTGIFNLVNGSLINCVDFNQKSSSSTVNINGTFNCTNKLTLSGGTTVNFDNASLNTVDFIVKQSASMNVSNSTFTITGDMELSGSSVSNFSNTDLSIGDKFKIIGGAKSTFTEGMLHITSSLIAQGAGEISIDGTDLTVDGETKLEGGSKLMVSGEAQINLGDLIVKGGATIQGQNQAGALSFNSINIQGGGKITCASGNCNFTAGSTPPSPLDLKTGTQVLPVKLLFFKAFTQKNKVILSWATALEENNAFFELEKSYDAKSWTIIEIIPGAGNSNQRLDYSSEDKITTSVSIIYYRLKQIDVDEKFSYSPIQLIRNTSTNKQTSIYPNPSNGYFKIQSTLDIESIKIFSTQGQLIQTIANNNDGSVEIKLSDNLIKGQYILLLTNKKGVESHRIMIQ